MRWLALVLEDLAIGISNDPTAPDHGAYTDIEDLHGGKTSVALAAGSMYLVVGKKEVMGPGHARLCTQSHLGTFDR